MQVQNKNYARPIKHCVIVDDDPAAIELLSMYIVKEKSLEIYKCYESIELLELDVKKGLRCNIIFLDVEMPGKSGLEMVGSLRQITDFLILTTSHSKYALKAFDEFVDQFLLKPYSYLTFSEKVNHLLNSEKDTLALPKTTTFLKISYEHQFKYLDTNEILYIEADRNDIIIHCRSEKFKTRKTLSFFLEQLDKNYFFRIAKSYIISLKFLKQIDTQNVWLENGIKLPIGKHFRNNFNHILSKYHLRSNK